MNENGSFYAVRFKSDLDIIFERTDSFINRSIMHVCKIGEVHVD